MQKDTKKPFMSLEIEGLEKEIQEINSSSAPIKGRIKRKTTSLYDKMSLRFYQFENFFLDEQEGKGNSKFTLEYYKRCFKKLYYFFAFEVPIDESEYQKLLDSDEPDSKIKYGSIMPIAVLEMDNFESKFRYWLKEVEQVNEQTVSSYFRGYRAIVYYAMEKGWIDNHKITISEGEADIKNCYTDTEINRLLKKPSEDDYTQYRNWVIINYLLATGNRVGSIVDLKTNDIDFEEGYINVNRQKNKKPARLPLVKKIIPILKEYIEFYRTDDERYILLGVPLFPNRFGEKMTENGLKKSISDYNKSRGVQKTSIHLFRHTFAKRWIIDGGDLFSLQKILGHSSLKMVQHYSNLYSTDVKKMAEQHAPITKTKTRSGMTMQRRK